MCSLSLSKYIYIYCIIHHIYIYMYTCTYLYIYLREIHIRQPVILNSGFNPVPGLHSASDLGSAAWTVKFPRNH